MKAKKKVVKCVFLTATGLCDCKDNFGKATRHKRLKMKCNHTNKFKCPYYLNSPVVKDGG